jgi:hypothetical protein
MLLPLLALLTSFAELDYVYRPARQSGDDAVASLLKSTQTPPSSGVCMKKFILSDKNRCISFAFALILFPFFGLKLLATHSNAIRRLTVQIALTKLSPVFGYEGVYVANLILFAIYAILFFCFA